MSVQPEQGPADTLQFPVIGIGASAGGLEAVTTLFRRADPQAGMAYVLVMHLDPDHESLLAELLSRKTYVAVKQIADGDPIEVDTLHVIPPGYGLQIEAGIFRLEKFSEPRGLRRPIDSFLKSLAEAQAERAAAVILSGTGGDGSTGTQAIKNAGGVTAVQDPEEAKYDGMPLSAIATKTVDFVLPASDILERLHLFFDRVEYKDLSEFDTNSEQALAHIFNILKVNVGHDFSGYKRATLFRRLARRMQVQDHVEINDYMAFLESSLAEQKALAQEFLINVTSFFRDREHFSALKEKVLRPLLERSDVAEEVRIWVPGCSSGQEAYSIAMLVEDLCSELKKRPLVQIFATDIDEDVLSVARRGQYPLSSYLEIPKPYQEAYTIGLDGRFEVVQKIRDMVRFSVHNLIQDPPFSKIDLISCRNLMIYLNEGLQNEVLPIFHFSLVHDGILFLGTSENVTRRAELFLTMDPSYRFYRKSPIAAKVRLNLPLSGLGKETQNAKPQKRLSQEIDFPRHDRITRSSMEVYNAYAPPFVRVTADGRIIDSSGDLSLFLKGLPTEDRTLENCIHDNICDAVLPLLAEVIADKKRRALREQEAHLQYGTQKFDIVLHHVKDGTVAIVFLLNGRFEPILDEYEVTPPTRDERIEELQHNLNIARLALKTKIEEAESTNEELKSSNEEMMSMNEELQSGNEELTTANEELSTTNQELKHKIAELSLANADLDNILQSADLFMLVVDRDLRIRHVTDAARQLVPIMRSDQGRVITEFNIHFDSFSFADAVEKVMASGVPFSGTSTLNNGNSLMLVRIVPHHKPDRTTNGATITVLNVSKEEELLRQAGRISGKLQMAADLTRVGFIEIDVDFQLAEIDQNAADLMLLPHGGQMKLAHLLTNLTEKEAAAITKQLNDAANSKTAQNIDFFVLGANDKRIELRMRLLADVSVAGRKTLYGPIVESS